MAKLQNVLTAEGPSGKHFVIEIPQIKGASLFFLINPVFILPSLSPSLSYTFTITPKTLKAIIVILGCLAEVEGKSLLLRCHALQTQDPEDPRYI